MKEPKYDLKAGLQRFTYQQKHKTMNIPRDTENPIEIRLRQIALQVNPEFDFNKEFHDKYAVVKIDKKEVPRLRIGRIKDLYPQDRLVRIKTKGNEDVLVPYDNVITISESEP